MLTTIATGMEGVVLIEPQVWHDERGYFFESFQERRYKEMGIHAHFVQDNEAFSQRGVLRGLHFQRAPYAQAKLVRVTKGEVLDVIVDLRPESTTYRESFTIVLSDQNKRQLFVPRGFAHGYVVRSEDALFTYKCDQYYAREHEGGIRYDDPSLGIDWQLEGLEVIVSEKDRSLPLLQDLVFDR